MCAFVIFLFFLSYATIEIIPNSLPDGTENRLEQVGIFGNWIIIGSELAPVEIDSNTVKYGGCYLGRLTNENSQIQILRALSLENVDYAASVGINANQIFVGAPLCKNNDGIATGCVLIYNRSEHGDVNLVQTLYPTSTGGVDSQFGSNMSVSGDYLVVGSPGENTVYIYQYEDAVWEQSGRYQQHMGGFGNAVSSNPIGFVLIGAPDHFYSSGFIFVLQNGDLKKSFSGMAINYNFGTALDADDSGSTIIVSSIGANIVQIFETENDWMSHKTAIVTSSSSYSNFGAAVALNSDGTKAYVSATSGNGIVFEFVRIDSTNWQQTQTFVGNENSEFGSTLGIDANFLIVGSKNGAFVFDITVGQITTTSIPTTISETILTTTTTTTMQATTTTTTTMEATTTLLVTSDPSFTTCDIEEIVANFPQLFPGQDGACKIALPIWQVGEADELVKCECLTAMDIDIFDSPGCYVHPNDQFTLEETARNCPSNFCEDITLSLCYCNMKSLQTFVPSDDEKCTDVFINWLDLTAEEHCECLSRYPDNFDGVSSCKIPYADKQWINIDSLKIEIDSCSEITSTSIIITSAPIEEGCKNDGEFCFFEFDVDECCNPGSRCDWRWSKENLNYLLSCGSYVDQSKDSTISFSFIFFIFILIFINY